MKLLHLNSGTKEKRYFGECYHISNVFNLCQVYWSLFCHLSLSVCRCKGVLSNHIVLETIQGGFTHYLPVTISWASSLLSDQKHSLIRDSVCHRDCPVQEHPAVIWGILLINLSCARTTTKNEVLSSISVWWTFSSLHRQLTFNGL